nr:EOG090X06AF [Megafenestra aurita]
MTGKLSASVIEYFGSDGGHECGYCKGTDTNHSHGMWAHSMSIQDYEKLINRGWRRSGNYCYKPAMKITCCPQYTIRCNAKDFVLNNSHKKVLKKVKNYMIQDRTIKLVGKPKFKKTLEDFITLDQLNCSHDLTVKLVDLSSAEFQSSMMVTFKLYQKYQTVIHKDKEDQCSIEQFKRFLVMSPLQKSKPKSGLDIEYGSFHQQYWIDGKLVAVGVIDILSTCLSSVYFFYDPDYSFLSLGTYASLREIAYIRQLAKQDPNFCWYYLGFYIHSCPKMFYKGQYKPSYLLCPEKYTFQPFSESVLKLNENKYSILDTETDSLNSSEDKPEVTILFQRRIMSYNSYSSMKPLDDQEIQEIKGYSKLVGKDCSLGMLLYRSSN